MLKVPVYNTEGTVVGQQALDDRLFAVPTEPMLIQQVVVAYQANARQPLAHTKTKGEVRGGGRKPWKQKGTGRARQGSIRAPQWRGGGVVFGPRSERRFGVALNKKMKQKALLMALSDKVASERFLVLDRLEASGKTKAWQQQLAKLMAVAAQRPRLPKILIIVPTIPLSLRRSSANLGGVEVIRTDSLNLPAVLRYDYALTTVDGVKQLEHWLLMKRGRS